MFEEVERSILSKFNRSKPPCSDEVMTWLFVMLAYLRILWAKHAAQSENASPQPLSTEVPAQAPVGEAS